MSPRLFTGRLGIALRGDHPAQAMASYLVACPHGNMLGLFRLPLAYFEVDLGMKRSLARRCLTRLQELGFLFYDAQSETVWIVEAWRIELCSDDMKPNDNRRAEVAKLIRQQIGSPLVARFLARYPATKAAVESLIPTPLEAPLVAPPEGVARHARDQGSENREQEQEQEQDQEQDREPFNPVGPRRPHERAEIVWRVQEVWSTHLEARRRFYRNENGADPTSEPTFTPEIRDYIRGALQRFDDELMGPDQRVEWKAKSKTRAAGIGIFLSDWHTGHDQKNDRRNGGKTYLEPWRPWKRQRDKGDPVERFAELYFAQRR